MVTSGRPAVEGWFVDGPEPVLIGSACSACGCVFFPPTGGHCRNPGCSGEDLADTALSRRGRIWSYTDARYQPPAPYVATSDPYEPFSIVAVELPEGLTVLGQVSEGYGLSDLRIGGEVELVVEPLYADGTGPRTTWRWRPTGESR